MLGGRKMDINLLWYSEQVLQAATKIRMDYSDISFAEALEIVKIGAEHAKADMLHKIYYDGVEVYTKTEVPLIMRESEIKVDLAGYLDVSGKVETTKEAE